MKNSNLFISRLKELMLDQKLTVNALAKAVPCDNSAIARWLDGQYYPRYYLLIKLADYFNCTVDFLLGLSEDDSPLKYKNDITLDFKVQFLKKRPNINITDYKMAKVLGIQQSTISKWINKNQVPEVCTLIKLSELLGCSVEFLIGRTNY